MIKTHKLTSLVFFFLIIFLILLLVINNAQDFFTIIKIVIFAIIIAYLLIPVVKLFERIMPRNIAVLLLLLIFILVIGGAITFLLPAIIKQISSIRFDIPKISDKISQIVVGIQKKLDELNLPYNINDTLQTTIQEIQLKITKSSGKSLDKLINVAGKLAEALLVPVVGFYFIKDRDYFKVLLMKVIPLNLREGIIKTSREINTVLSRFIRGQLLIAAIIAVFTTIGYWIIGLPYALLAGLIAGILELVPYFGPYLGAIPAATIALLNEPKKILWVIVVVFIIQQLEGSLITPRIMGETVGLHPVFIILILFTGGLLFGFLGILFSVPVVLILKIIFKNLYLSIVR